MTRHATTSLLASLALSATLFAACGDDAHPASDAAVTGADAASADAALPIIDGGDVDAAADDAGPEPDAYMPVGSPSCAELTTPASTMTTYPTTYSGDLAGAEANLDVTNATHCTASNAPFGQHAAGPDQVVALTGLTPGTVYYVKLDGEDDLAAYVTTGCDPAMPGPGADQCLAFVDGGVTGLEVISFVAPADGKAFVVVDFYSADQAPDPTTYTLTVTTEGCLESFDCHTPTASACQVSTATCGTNDFCVGDDTAAEALSDDGPAGATPVTLSGTPTVINANICNDSSQPGLELDYYKFTVANGGAVTAQVGWADPAVDIDIRIQDEQRNVVGMSLWQNPETIALTYLPAGTYFLSVLRYEPSDSTAVTPYTVTLTANPTLACVTSADCATTFQNQIFRAACNAQGACVDKAGAGAVPLAGICDSDDDCVAATGSTCADNDFTAGAATRSICTLECNADADCTGVAANAKCTTGGDPNVCLLPCTTDEQCPVVAGTPTGNAPWVHAVCNVAQGRCEL